ncbi:MAG: hypothetical protein Q7K65_05275, partial [Candidatus Buchananbacteria bacterium]|nr:hypothetical protein [Candidatus Buchananbacteria bacterium]
KMTEHQLKLLKNVEHQQVSGGPIFEFGPGWGVKIKKWVKKYLFGGDCTLCRNTRYILLAGIIILIIGWPQFKSLINDKEQQALTISETKITETVQLSDSKIKLARRALADYLDKFTDTNITNGQKVFIETVLSQTMTDELKLGTQIDFDFENIKTLIEQSRLLTPSQLQKWEKYAKSVKF